MTSTEKINLLGLIADMKEVDYRNTLALAGLVELLIDKGILSGEEFAAKARSLEEDAIENPAGLHARR